MELDVVLLSRIQFALTIMFHYLFPPLTIGLGVVLVMMEGTYLRTKNPQYEAMAKFWTKIFAVNFAMGVATGIVMEFEFGTNWSNYSRFVGDIFGSALAAEGIFAFFLESGFLAVLVFGWDRVSPRMHFIATFMVALGAIFSSVWIVVANSWMQTPAGFRYEPGMNRAEITDFWQMVLNPSTPFRIVHVWMGAFVLGAFVVMSISAWYILKGRHLDFAKRSFAIAMALGTIASVGTLLTGHFHAEQVARTQPAKLAGFEGHFETGEGGAKAWLFGIPNMETQKVDFGIGIPNALSMMVHFDPNKPVTGLDQFPREDWPPVPVIFQTYHLMVVLGLFFIGLSVLSTILYLRGALFEKRWLLWVWVFAFLGAYVANQTGWVSAEMGRQPWIVYGLMRTSDAVSQVVTGPMILSSIIMFSLIYLALFLVYVFVLNNKIQHGPDTMEAMPSVTTGASLIDAAARLANPAGFSMSAAHEEDWEQKTEGSKPVDTGVTEDSGESEEEKP